MLIKEVESIVGLSKKSIRFYEDNNLLNPKRNSTNDYREYSKEDIEKLKTIKLLRELGVSIRELKLLNENKLTLKECLDDRIYKIEAEEKKYQRAKEICREIKKSNDEFDNIDIDRYFKEINILNKEGFTMRNLQVNNYKKIREAVISSLTFSLFFLFLMAVITYFEFTEIDKMPWLIYILLMTMLIVPVFGITINLIKRIKEINGGEEDEASKY